jgi:hypothetical protein
MTCCRCCFFDEATAWCSCASARELLLVEYFEFTAVECECECECGVITAANNCEDCFFSCLRFCLWRLRKRTFTASAVRPAIPALIFDQLLPTSLCFWSRSSSSSTEKGPRFNCGSSWKHQRWRHCFEVRPSIWVAIRPQSAPHALTISHNFLSSHATHRPLIIPGRRVLLQRCKHCASSRPGTASAMTFHPLPLCLATAWVRS